MATDLYATLGLKKGASKAEIKKAYRKLARDLHPDRHKGDKSKEEEFKKVSRAYQVLADEKKRQLYDEFGEAGLREGFDPDMARQYGAWQGGAGRGAEGPTGFDPSGFGFDFNFQDLFGGKFDEVFRRGTTEGRRGRGARRAPKPRAGDFESEVKLDLADALRGCEREFTFQMPDGDRTLRVRIPPGVADGGRVRLKGQGRQAPDTEPGDLILKIHIRPHPHFRREDENLRLRLPVTPSEAFHGASVEVPTLDGPVNLRIPPRTRGGAKLRLRGKGVPKKDGGRGDLLVEVNVVLPETGDEKRIGDLVAQLEKEFKADPRANLRL